MGPAAPSMTRPARRTTTAQPGRTTRGGWGWKHQQERAKVKRFVDTGAARCVRCGGVIQPRSRWHFRSCRHPRQPPARRVPRSLARRMQREGGAGRIHTGAGVGTGSRTILPCETTTGGGWSYPTLQRTQPTCTATFTAGGNPFAELALAARHFLNHERTPEYACPAVAFVARKPLRRYGSRF